MSNEPIDGSGLSLKERARALATQLELTPKQTEILVSELRNALVPVRHRLKLDSFGQAYGVGAKGTDWVTPLRGVLRVLALADALAEVASTSPKS